MANILAREVTEFAYEFDFYTMVDEFSSEAQAEAETAKMLVKDPIAVVRYLESFQVPSANALIERIMLCF